MSLLVRSCFFLLLLSLSHEAAAQAPVANFMATTPTQGCAPLLVQFTNTSTGTNSGTTYSWNFNNGPGGSSLQSPSTTFTAPGTYTVSLTVTNPGSGGGTSTKTQTAYITVYPVPTPSWTVSNANGCAPLPVTFTNTTALGTPGAGTYNWNFGDGYSVNGVTSPSHTYATGGMYAVTLMATNSQGCSKTVSVAQQVTVKPKPSAAFNALPTVLCNIPASTTFTALPSSGTAPYSYAWAFGDNTTGTGSSPSHTYTSAGPFDVRLIVSDANGCADTLLKSAYITSSSTTAAFTAPTICPGVPAQLTNTTVPTAVAASWFISGASPSASTALNPSFTFPSAGTYTAQLIATGSGGCLDTVVQNVVVSAPPAVSYTASPSAPCPAPATVAFTNTTTGAASYTWYFGDGTTSNTLSPTHTYASNGFYTDSLVAVSAAGCTARLAKPNDIKVRNIIMALSAVPSDGCVPLPVTFGALLNTTTPGPGPSPYPLPIGSYSWDFGDNTALSSSAAPTHTYTTAGIFRVKLTAVTANGCVIVDSITVRAGTPPVASFTYTPSVQCTHQPIAFTNTSTGTITDYYWNFGDGGTSTLPSPVYKYAIPGTYNVTLTAGYNGCEDTFLVPNAVISRPPNAKFAINYQCAQPQTVSFTNQSQGVTSLLWTFSDGTTSTATNPVKTFPSLGLHSAQLVTFNSTYGCSDTLALSVVLLNGTPAIVPPTTALCWGDTATFRLAYPGAQPLNPAWKLLSGATVLKSAQDTLIGYRFNNPGLYSLQLIVEDPHGCADTLLSPNSITIARPLVKFKASDTVGCTPLAPVFTDTSSNTPGVATASRTWRWGTGASTTVTGSTASYTYTTAGTYDVRLVVTDVLGCTDSLTKPAYIDARHPKALFSANDTSACTGQVIAFTSTSTGVAPLTYDWAFGDGTTGTGAIATHAYGAVGAYDVRLIVTDASGCKDTLLKPAAITLTRPSASFTASDTQAICPPLLVQFTNTSPASAVYYSWTFIGTGTSSTIPNPSNVYTASGQYPVRLVVFDAQNCPDTAFKTVRVLGYAGALTYTPLIGCRPLQVQFQSALSNVPSIIWDFSDGVTASATGNTITHTYTTPGAYVPKLLISDGQGCVTSSTGVDTIKVDGVNAGFQTGPACLGSPVQFTDTSKSFFSPVSGRLWLFPGGASTTTPNPVQSFGGVGSYNVTLVATNGRGCTDTVLRQITIRPLPVVDAGGDTVVCVNDAVGLQASGAVSYAWTPAGSLDNPAIPNPKASPTVATRYTVVGTDAYGCKGSDTVRVSVKTKTTSSVAGDVAMCQGSGVQLVARGAETYQWVPATALDNPTSPTPIANPATSTVYTVVAREGSCLPDTQRVRVTVNPKPDVNAGGDVRMVAGGSVVLGVTASNADVFRWSPDTALSCSECPVPTASPKRATTYTVIGANRFGCSDTDAVTVLVQCNGSQIFVPNTFTPDGNGENDVFYPHGIGLDRANSFRIYNRWGQVVFEKTGFALNDRTAGWDGTFGGEKLPPDVFVYVLEAVCDNGETIVWKGDVTLVR